LFDIYAPRVSSALAFAIAQGGNKN